MNNSVFLGANGLTSTSANHISNMAKEAYQTVLEELNAIKLYDECISLIGSGLETPISIGTTKETLSLVPQMLEDVAALKSLIAWLREAIKARREMLEELNEMSLGDYCKEMGIELPIYPHREDYRPITEEEYYDSLGIKERNTYYTLETKCAVYGKLIHENGTLNKARKDLAKVITNPSVVCDSGRDTVITTRKPSIDTDTIDKIFFSLQAKHREYQASLNAIKHQCELAVAKDELEKLNAYKADYNECARKTQQLELDMKEYKKQKVAELQALKIVIPDNLRRAYDMVASLGK